MALLDKLRDAAAAAPDTDLLTFFGIGPGDPLRWDKDTLTVGGETVPMAEARRALAGPPVPQTPVPRRTVTIGDL